MFCFSSLLVEREKKVREEQLYEKSIEVEQKRKQIGLERSAAEQILTSQFPVAWDKARAALAEITLADCEAEIINTAFVPEAVQVSSRGSWWLSIMVDAMSI